jgi:hypothetical protein
MTTFWHTAKIIRGLYRLCREDFPYGLEEVYQIKPLFFRPTTVFGKIIPIIISVGWLAFLAWKLTLLLMGTP